MLSLAPSPSSTLSLCFQSGFYWQQSKKENPVDNIDKLEMANALLDEEENLILSDLTEKLQFSTEKEDSSLHLRLFSSKPPQQNNCNALSSLVIMR